MKKQENFSQQPKQVLIIRTDTDPKMRKGKMIAQGAHAAMAVILERLFGAYGERTWEINEEKKVVKANIEIDMESPFYIWLSTHFTKIVLGGTLSDILAAHRQAKIDGVPCALIQDSGFTEFDGRLTLTALAIGPDLPENIDKITGHLELL